MLGDAGRSFVVGYGKDPPERAHHRGASCRPGDCSGAQLATPEPNPNVIVGALVGGVPHQGLPPPVCKEQWNSCRRSGLHLSNKLVVEAHNPVAARTVIIKRMQCFHIRKGARQ